MRHKGTAFHAPHYFSYQTAIQQDISSTEWGMTQETPNKQKIIDHNSQAQDKVERSYLHSPWFLQVKHHAKIIAPR